jgi:hypothetical protein
MRSILAMLLCAGFGLIPYAAGYAQNPQPAPPGVQPPPVASPSAPTPPPEKVAPGALADNQTLSDRLSRQKGTLHPPAAVDPGMTVQPHATGSMPVIPPPGTPGGNQNVVPK